MTEPDFAMETDQLLHNRVPEPVNDYDGVRRDSINVKADFDARLVGSLLVDSIPGESPKCQIVQPGRSMKRPSVILSYILQNSIQTIAVLVVGRLGADELSAAAFSYMLAFVTGEWSVSLGVQRRLDPIIENDLQVGASHSGARQLSTRWGHRPLRADPRDRTSRSTSSDA